MTWRYINQPTVTLKVYPIQLQGCTDPPTQLIRQEFILARQSRSGQAPLKTSTHLVLALLNIPGDIHSNPRPDDTVYYYPVCSLQVTWECRALWSWFSISLSAQDWMSTMQMLKNLYWFKVRRKKSKHSSRRILQTTIREEVDKWGENGEVWKIRTHYKKCHPHIRRHHHPRWWLQSPRHWLVQLHILTKSSRPSHMQKPIISTWRYWIRTSTGWAYKL